MFGCSPTDTVSSGLISTSAVYKTFTTTFHHEHALVLFCLTVDVSNKVVATRCFECLRLRYLTLRYGRYLRSTTSRT